MKTTSRFILRLALVFSFFTLLQCSEAEDADTRAVAFLSVPEKPVVIDAKFSRLVDNGGEELELIEVEPPWFKANYTFGNGSNLPVTIQTITYKVHGISKTTGERVTVEYSLDPVEFPLNKDDDDTNDQYYLAELAPGADFTNTDVEWYVGGLPSKDVVVSLNYTIEAEAVGWFGWHDEPIKTFRKKIYLETSD